MIHSRPSARGAHENQANLAGFARGEPDSVGLLAVCACANRSSNANASPQPTATASATIAPTATVEIPDPVALFSGLPVDSYEEAILSFLTAGGQPADLAAALAGPAETPTGHAGWSGEVNGDGQPDFIASLVQPDEAAMIPRAAC